MSMTAEEEAQKTFQIIRKSLESRSNFKVEAGAGAGKTYSLIQALKYILENKSFYLPREDQRIACLTYTRVARDEVKARTDGDPAIFTDTLHGFFWEMIRPYQGFLRAALKSVDIWQELVGDNTDISNFKVDYTIGIRVVHENVIMLHHDDIPTMAKKLFGNEKFRSLIADRFPIIFIDEYQDTPEGLAEAILSGYKGDRNSPVIGLFGDHWQQIYDRTCGAIEIYGSVEKGKESLKSIQKRSNFRSDSAIVDFLNKLRPELPQFSREGAGEGSITIYHSNSWPGERQTRNWKGQISKKATSDCLKWLLSCSPSSAWIQSSKNPKILMLTHASIARELGYESLPNIYHYNDNFTEKKDPVISYLVDVIEPSMNAFINRKYGDLFKLLVNGRPALKSLAEKVTWTNFFNSLGSAMKAEKVGDVLDLLMNQKLFSVPTALEKLESDLLESRRSGEEISRRLQEYEKLRDVSYSEIKALSSYLDENTVFSTKHSVKGAEFDDVVVVIGRGWSKYDFAEMISGYSFSADSNLIQSDRFLRSRNLFYVAVSRAKKNLALLFVQKLEEDALSVLQEWVGSQNIISIEFDGQGNPISR